MMKYHKMVSVSQNFLYLEDFDFEKFYGEPSSSICVLFTPRSGSTLLASLMYQTMSLGFPLEYFSSVNMRVLQKRLTGLSFSKLSPLYSVRTSSNGVFSFKWNANDSLATTKIMKLISPRFFLVIDREDKNAQTRSLAFARLTKEWVRAKGQKSSERPDITKEQFLEAEKALEKRQNDIRSFVRTTSSPVLYLTYEELLNNTKKMMKKILDFVQVDGNPDVDITEVPIEKQTR